MNDTKIDDWKRAFELAGVDTEKLKEVSQKIGEAVQAIYNELIAAINSLAQPPVDALEELKKCCALDELEPTARKKMRERDRRQAVKHTNKVRFSRHCQNCMRWSVKRRTKSRERAARGPPGWGGP